MEKEVRHAPAFIHAKGRITRRAIHPVLCRGDNGNRALPCESNLENEVAFFHQEQVFVANLQPTTRRFVKDAAPKAVDADFRILGAGLHVHTTAFQFQQLAETYSWRI